MEHMQDGRYHDIVALNPDFRAGRWVAMVNAAWDLTLEGCTLVALVPQDFTLPLPTVPGHEQLMRTLREVRGYAVENVQEMFYIEDRYVFASILVLKR